MITNTLARLESGDQGTFGRLVVPGFSRMLYTGELPWRENRQRVSCFPDAAWCVEHGLLLPEGEYTVVMRRSPRFGWMYWISDVPARSFCLIHPANLMGDVARGFHTQLEGCVALGYSLGWLDRQKAVLRSRPAVVDFMNFMGRESFRLRVVNEF